MGQLIVGKSIISQRLIKNGVETQVKHSTYDLTIGEIFPAGEKSVTVKEDELFYLKPRQTVLVLSKEEFGLPATVTGIATLRTTLTKKGLLALNVGVIDPFFNGPISTTLINFSEKEVPIKIGMPFFRVLFLEHDDTTDFHHASEDKTTACYREELKIDAYRDFPKNFMNLPKFDDRFYANTAWRMIKGLTKQYWYFSIPFWLTLLAGTYLTFSGTNFARLVTLLKDIKAVVPFL